MKMTTHVLKDDCGCEMATVHGAPLGCGPHGEPWHTSPTREGWQRTGARTYARLCPEHLAKVRAAIFPSEVEA